jgi:ribosomal protein S18 acetylase RimI-like enzyme
LHRAPGDLPIAAIDQARLGRRAITAADMPFLLELYETTRADELMQVPWSAEQKSAFVLQQFTAQHAHWQTNYTVGMSWDVLLYENVPIGRLYVGRWTGEIRVVDIAVMPEFRNSGIGTLLFRELFEEADASGCTVSIHVEIYNPARNLYERLGFEPVRELGVYLLMERKPALSAPPPGRTQPNQHVIHSEGGIRT